MNYLNNDPISINHLASSKLQLNGIFISALPAFFFKKSFSNILQKLYFKKPHLV